MNISHVSITTDEDGNPIFQPGLILTTNAFKVDDNSEQTLIDTFTFKANKILPDVKIHRGEDMTIDRHAITVIVKNDQTAPWFAELPNESMRDTLMVFSYRGPWATFHHNSTEKHVRDALNAWKQELRCDAWKKGIKVTAAGDDVVCMATLSEAVKHLPQNSDFLMVYSQPSTKPLYDMLNIDMNEWHSLLFRVDEDDKQIVVRTFDKSVSKADLEPKTNEEPKACVVCHNQSEPTKRACKVCKRDYQCSTCRASAHQAFKEGKNTRCSKCGFYRPIFLTHIHSFALHHEEDDTVMLLQKTRLEKVHGGHIHMIRK